MVNSRFFATTAKGIESILAKELRVLGVQNIAPVTGGVHFEGSMRDMYRANLWLRTANRVLMQLAEFPCSTPEALYEHTRQIPWDQWTSIQQTLAVNCHCRDSSITHSHYAALKIKDAIVDQFRDKTGRRPNVDTKHPFLRVNAYISEDVCVLSLDSSGDGLHMRGYRRQSTGAPLRETLAAAIVDIVGWDGEGFFIDPMCGSGTILIEAALRTMNYAPGLLRCRDNGFGFQRWPRFDKRLWESQIGEATNQIRDNIPGRVLGYDISRLAIEVATENVAASGLARKIRLARGDVLNLYPSGHTGRVVCNLPFGERSGRSEELVTLYRAVSDILKQRCTGYKAYLFTGNLALAKSIALRTSRRFTLYNGPIECRLLEYELY